MKKSLLIIIILSFSILMIVNFILVKNYARGYKIFEPSKLAHDFTLKYDTYNDYSINEEGFIQIIGKGDSIKIEGYKFKINQILEYGTNKNDLFVKVLSNENKKYFVKVSLDESKPKGDKIWFDVFKEITNLKTQLKWYNLENAKFYINIFKMLHWIIILSIATIFVFIVKDKNSSRNITSKHL